MPVCLNHMSILQRYKVIGAHEKRKHRLFADAELLIIAYSKLNM